LLGDMAGSGTKSEVLDTLKGFVFKEVLNSDAARKVIFLLLKGPDKKDAVLVCDKLPFVENQDVIAEWLNESSCHHQLTNSYFHSYLLDLPHKHNETKTTLIYPATERDIVKYRRRENFLVQETPEDFEKLTVPYIESISSNLEWVYNFIDGKAEVERVVFEDKDPVNGFVIAPDLKWAGKDVDNLYLLAVVKRRDLRCVRDLTASDLPLLEGIRDKTIKLMEEKYGIGANQTLMYFHYQPTFYHLHLHIINLKYEAPGLNTTCILLQNVIDNLRNCPDYYKKATLSFYRRQDPLLERYRVAGRL